MPKNHNTGIIGANIKGLEAQLSLQIITYSRILLLAVALELQLEWVTACRGR